MGRKLNLFGHIPVLSAVKKQKALLKIENELASIHTHRSVAPIPNLACKMGILLSAIPEGCSDCVQSGMGSVL